MPKPTPLPPIELLELNFDYDPVTGNLFTKLGAVCSNNDRSTGQMKVKVGRKSTSVQRVCWALYYRKDPINMHITHLNGNPRDNRIENLVAKKIRKKR